MQCTKQQQGVAVAQLVNYTLLNAYSFTAAAPNCASTNKT